MPSKSHVRDIAASWARERPDLEPADYLHFIYAMRLGRLLDRVDDRRNRKVYGVSGADMRVLFALRRSGKPYMRRPTDLFRALLVTSGAITKQVDRLEKAGFVAREPDPGHAAGFLVRLTAPGVKLADKAMTALAQSSVLSAGRTTLTRTERAKLIELCQKALLGLEDLPDEEFA